MPKVKHMPCEIRFYVSEEMHDWLKSSALKRGESLAVFLRSAISDLIDRAERGVVVRSTDPLIEAIAKKLGVELPEKQPDSEGENLVEKEGEIQ